MKRLDKRQAILRTAAQLFMRRRFHEIKLDEVARRARVGKGTIYLYFKDKDDLFCQTATDGFDDLCMLVQKQISEPKPFPQILHEACAHISGFFEKRQPLMRMLMESGIPRNRALFHQRGREHHDRLRQALATVIGRGVAQGCVRSDLNPEMLAAFLLGMLRTRSMELRQQAPTGCSIDGVIDLFCRGAAGHSSGKHTA